MVGGGNLRQARAFFQIIPVGSTHPRLLAIGGQGAYSTLDTSEWWQEEENSWEEGPTLSTGRSSFATIMAPPHLVCSEIDPPAHSCPADENASQACVFSTVKPGDSQELLELFKLVGYLYDTHTQETQPKFARVKATSSPALRPA